MKAFALREGGSFKYDRPGEIEAPLAGNLFILLLSFAPPPPQKKKNNNNNNNNDNNNIHIRDRVTTTDKPITVGPTIGKISKMKATLGLDKEKLDGKAKSSRRGS